MSGLLSPPSKMINLSVADTIDERTINKKKLTPFTIQVRPRQPGPAWTRPHLSPLALRRT